MPSITVKHCCASYGDYKITGVIVVASDTLLVTEVSVNNKGNIVLSDGHCEGTLENVLKITHGGMMVRGFEVQFSEY